MTTAVRPDHLAHGHHACRHVDRLRAADPFVPDGVGDRVADNWRPLLAIADAAGGRWPAEARKAATEISA
ncbi:MAG: DUF3631 domain-containing protein, partial [candidate division NC10 bacterium]